MSSKRHNNNESALESTNKRLKPNPPVISASVHDISRRINEAKERISLSKASSNATQGRGLDAQVHPALLALQSTDQSDPVFKQKLLIPKFATVKANVKLVQDEISRKERKQQKYTEALAKKRELDLKIKKPEEEFAAFIKNPHFDPQLSTQSAFIPKPKVTI